MKKMIPALLAAALLLAGCHSTAAAAETTPAPSEIPAAVETVLPSQAPIPEPSEAPATAPTEPPTEPPTEQRYTLSFVGDCTLGCHTVHRGMGFGFLKVVGDDVLYPMENVRSYFENDDLTFANLEGILNDGDAKPDPEKVYNFKGPTSYTGILTENSIEVVSLANNHSMDYGPEGYASTVEALDAAGVSYAERDQSTIVTSESGLTVGIYAILFYKVDEDRMVEEIAKLAEQCDIVIFAPHWGVEGSYRVIDVQERQAHKAIDAGADIVWGHHPHLLQPVEYYEDGVIFYSMGNFCFGGNMYPSDMDTAILRQEVIRSPEGEISLGELTVIPCSVSSMEVRNNFQPTPYEEGSAGWNRVYKRLGLD